MTAIGMRSRAVILTLALIVAMVALVTFGPASVFESRDAFIDEPEAQSRQTGAIFEQGVNQLRNREYWLAIESFKDVLRLSPSMPEAYSNIGFAHFELENYNHAANAFRAAIDLRAEQVNAYWGLAVTLEAMCDIPGAIGSMRTYIHLSGPDDPYQKRAYAALWEWDQIKQNNKTAEQGMAWCS